MHFKSSAQIRKEFLEFFEEKQHLIVPSAPVVPKDDPTLMFTNAGMNQFKPLFLGEQDALKEQGKKWKRAADTQKCIRVSGKHNDLEEVGVDTYHHTLFEMLGNWSFGDYFKKEAIAWAWELLVDRWGLEPDRLYATVFGGDDADGLPVDEEAEQLWAELTSIPKDHILRFGKKDNFWEMGDTGPCGPCSEIHIDLRSEEERASVDGKSLVNADDPRVMEIWNLVFIQFNRLSSGELKSLPARHVDTGMGFERVCAVLQSKTSNYDTDVFQPIIQEIAKRSGKTYGEKEADDIAMRVIADHLRAVSFSISDGASPSNDGRGYVVRRILRRAVRYAWDALNIKKPFLFDLVSILADQMKEAFPELLEHAHYVSNVIEAEEKSFLRTLGQGIKLFEEVAEGKETISGEDAFKLHDTYGFPIDLTSLMARERGKTVDEAGFDRLMKEQKDRARAAGKFTIDQSDSDSWVEIDGHVPTSFVGYEKSSAQSRLTSWKKGKEGVWLSFEQTPFYAESGGQIADIGVITNGNDTLRVLDVQKMQDQFIHKVDRMPESLEGEWELVVDSGRRKEITKHHSATHLVHAALRSVLGDHVAQKGSLVTDDHLRFDFSHFEAVNPSQLDKIEEIVNERIQMNIARQEDRDIPIDEARKRGAMMLFGEKYGEKVRVITFDPDYSVELCGGIHVNATGEIGYFRFLHESSVAAGIRRITAVTGKTADQALRSEKHLLHNIGQLAGQTDDITHYFEKLIAERKSLEKELERLKTEAVAQELTSILNAPKDVLGVDLHVGELVGADMNMLKQMGYDALNRKPEANVTVLGSKDADAGKVYLVAAVSDDLIKEKGLKAGALVGKIARLVGGGGGGQPNLATAGGRSPEALEDALSSVQKILSEL